MPRRGGSAHDPGGTRRASARSPSPHGQPRRRRPRGRSATARWLAGLEAGIAAHHAGLVPPMKEAVEEAFAAGLVKVVFATETLALGINMPARSVVIEKLSKFTGERHEFLTPGEYTQLTGRAGRRGIDERRLRGRVLEPVRARSTRSRRSRRAGTDALVSSFRPTYNMAANLVRRYDRDDRAPPAEPLVRAVPRRPRRRRARARSSSAARSARRAPTSARAPPGHREYRGSPAARRRPRATDRRGWSNARSIGCVPATSCSPAAGTAAWSCSHTSARSGEEREAARAARRRPGATYAAWARATSTTRPGGRDLELPEPYAPRSPAFRRTVAERSPADGRDVRGRCAGARSAAATAVAEHPRPRPRHDARRVASSVRSATSQRLERRVRGRSESLARPVRPGAGPARVVGLRRRHGRSPTRGSCSPGSTPSADLLVAEAIRDGVFSTASAPELAARRVVLHLRAPRPRRTGAAWRHMRWPTKACRAARACDRTTRGATRTPTEDDASASPRPARPIPASSTRCTTGRRGDELADVLDDEVTGGDFVRHVKQCIDLLRQIADVASRPGRRRTARRRRRRAC